MTQILPYLFFLACPISMGLMMWMMMRKDHDAMAPKSDPRVGELQSQVNELRMALNERQGGDTAASLIPAANVDRE